MTLQKNHPEVEGRVFLMVAAVGCALPNQTTAQGYDNIEQMLRSVISKGGKVKVFGICLDVRGFRQLQLNEGIEPSNMNEFTTWTVKSDKVFTF